jgi:hypothetical protein
MNDRDQMKSSVRRMIERRVEGVAIVTFGMEDVLLEDLKLWEVPVVLVDVVSHSRDICNLDDDTENALPTDVRDDGSSFHDHTYRVLPSCLFTHLRKSEESQFQSFWEKSSGPLSTMMLGSALSKFAGPASDGVKLFPNCQLHTETPKSRRRST